MFRPVDVSRAVSKFPAAHAVANDIVAKHIPDGLFISGFKLAISSDDSNCPADRVRELYGRGDNINEGRGGNYVYIVPTRTNTYSDAITGARISIPRASYDASPFLNELTVFQLQVANRPADRVREIYGRGDNINQGRSEYYGYIVPTRTITDARISITASASQVGDLTSGTGYRYLITRKEKGKAPIVDWCLIRGRDKIPPGWHCKTIDINQDGKGDCLYLCSRLW